MYVHPGVKRSISGKRYLAWALGLGVAGLLGVPKAAFAQTQVNAGFSFYQEDEFEAGTSETQSSPDYTSTAMISVNPNIGGGSDGYVNVVDGNGNWVVQNMPVIPQQSSATTSAPVDLGTPDDSQDASESAAVYFSTNPVASAPSGGTDQSYSLATDDIDPQGAGTDPNEATDETEYNPTIGPGGAPGVNSFSPNWAGIFSGTTLVWVKNFNTYNVQAALNQCGPSAEANGINYLATNNATFAAALGVNFNNNPGQGIFSSMAKTGTTYTPTGAYPYAGNASTYYVSTANANSAASIQTLTNSGSAATSSLVALMDVATARQAGTVAGPGPIYSETQNRTAGSGVYPLQGLINFMNGYAAPNLKVSVGYESVAHLKTRPCR